MTPEIVAVCRSADHSFSKVPISEIRLLRGLGVEGDAHAGVTVKHRSRVAKDPAQPNLRQVHLLHSELLDELCATGFTVVPGSLGENITTRSVDLLALPAQTQLCIGDEAVIEVTGLRNPCAQLDGYQRGLTAAVLERDENGPLVRKAGIMAIVLKGGQVRPGDEISIRYPPQPHSPLLVV